MTEAIGASVLDRYKPAVEKEGGNKDVEDFGQNEFMTLMLTQLKYQDPFKPMENGEFLAQMAQFSTVAGIEGMNASMSSFISEQTASQTLQAAGLLGKTVVTEGSSATLPESGNLESLFSIPETSPKANVIFSNAAGETVHAIEFSDLDSGIHKISWDGYNEDGNRAPSSSYSISVEYVDSAGGLSTAETSISTEIEGVNFGVGNAKPTLSTSDGRELSISEIRKIL
ncbi:hypothetical protein AB833_21890 [Chromatiales bacterium (ex Bugula neritina AB1)]|nr:hypothetical protein AB833_21890 [Chromatiales bacterium (ex Bugula neritina AB1)]